MKQVQLLEKRQQLLKQAIADNLDLLIGSLAWSGSLALRTVFDADRSRDVAEELLDNDEVRSQLTENLGSAIEAALKLFSRMSHRVRWC